MHRGVCRCVRSLIDGVRRYEETKRGRYSARFAALANGQEPLALLITCADSRVVPSLVALSNPGELFVVRNVANLVPTSADAEHGDASVASSVWYALEVLNIPDVIVCGHSGCGGIKALMGPSPPSAALRRWLATASSALTRWREGGPLDPSLADFDQVSQISVLQQLDNLTTHELVRARVESGAVRLHAWWFDIAKGQLLAHSKDAGRFLPAIDAHGPETSAAE